MKKDDFRKALEDAKKVDPIERTYGIHLPEIHEDAKVFAWPMTAEEREELPDLMNDIQQWAIVILCIKDEEGNRLFEPSDIEFLDGLGLDVRRRLFEPAFQLSGLGNDYSVR